MKAFPRIRWASFWQSTLLVSLAGFCCLLSFTTARAQPLTKMKIGYSGTGNTQYILELPRRQGVFRKNGLDPEIVYVTSGSLLSQALIAGNFDVALTRGTTPMLGDCADRINTSSPTTAITSMMSFLQRPKSLA